ncbi:hypothetical protein P691DRAFT_854057 [Macrolepiota fuliginosa MF-IS2]|uniref:Uncharacterized protein n=1 Tax=Macrolepiota fuliginosa MF-IS2 TaxID=1400762 RepID=A0A9P5X1E3_9AGAR|nr:hypothetical protein P691DRAFT_854057 [Macrolepiota fuliginosa MF-IS2]
MAQRIMIAPITQNHWLVGKVVLGKLMLQNLECSKLVIIATPDNLIEFDTLWNHDQVEAKLKILFPNAFSWLKLSWQPVFSGSQWCLISFTEGIPDATILGWQPPSQAQPIFGPILDSPSSSELEDPYQLTTCMFSGGLEGVQDKIAEDSKSSGGTLFDPVQKKVRINYAEISSESASEAECQPTQLEYYHWLLCSKLTHFKPLKR